MSAYVCATLEIVALPPSIRPAAGCRRRVGDIDAQRQPSPNPTRTLFHVEICESRRRGFFPGGRGRPAAKPRLDSPDAVPFTSVSTVATPFHVERTQRIHPMQDQDAGLNPGHQAPGHL